MPLTHLEYDQLKCAINAMGEPQSSGYAKTEAVNRGLVLDLLLRYTVEYPAPNPHPVPLPAVPPTATA